MSIFDSFGGQQQTQAPRVTPQQALSQLQNDPSGTLRQCGLSVPAGMTNPQQMVQHLMQSGQLPQGVFGQAMQIVSWMMGGR